jgi:hypothetical protein
MVTRKTMWQQTTKIGGRPGIRKSKQKKTRNVKGRARSEKQLVQQPETIRKTNDTRVRIDNIETMTLKSSDDMKKGDMIRVTVKKARELLLSNL